MRPIASDTEQVGGATLRDANMAQIALLEPELLNYCKQSRERAQAAWPHRLLCRVSGYVLALDHRDECPDCTRRKEGLADTHALAQRRAEQTMDTR